MSLAFELARHARLRALLFRDLSNAAEVWRTYRTGALGPPSKFRNGLTLFHAPGDAPVFLSFEVFANGCYRRRIAPSGRGVFEASGFTFASACTARCGSLFYARRAG